MYNVLILDALDTEVNPQVSGQILHAIKLWNKKNTDGQLSMITIEHNYEAPKTNNRQDITGYKALVGCTIYIKKDMYRMLFISFKFLLPLSCHVCVMLFSMSCHICVMLFPLSCHACVMLFSMSCHICVMLFPLSCHACVMLFLLLCTIYVMLFPLSCHVVSIVMSCLCHVVSIVMS